MSESVDKAGIMIMQKSRRTLHDEEAVCIKIISSSRFLHMGFNNIGRHCREGKHDFLAHFKQIIEDPTLVFSNTQCQIKGLHFARNYLSVDPWQLLAL